MKPLFLCTLALALYGCAEDYGEPCDLPESRVVEAYCEPAVDQEEGATSATCVFTNSSQCSSRMCARYIGSRDFCTQECDAEEEGSCPGGSYCQIVPANDLAFCVPEFILESVQN